MLGFSVLKLLFTALLVYLVWRGFKMVGEVSARGAERSARKRHSVNPPARGGTLDLKPCPHCGTYMTVGSRCPTCERGS